MVSSCLGDWKQVQDARFDSHLTGIKNESFYWRTKTIAHNKYEKVKPNLQCQWKSILETGHCVYLEVFSIFPPFVLVKKQNIAKGKEAFQGKFVVIVELFAR